LSSGGGVVFEVDPGPFEVVGDELGLGGCGGDDGGGEGHFEAWIADFHVMSPYEMVCVVKNGLFDGPAGGMYIEISGLPVIVVLVFGLQSGSGCLVCW